MFFGKLFCFCIILFALSVYPLLFRQASKQLRRQFGRRVIHLTDNAADVDAVAISIKGGRSERAHLLDDVSHHIQRRQRADQLPTCIHHRQTMETVLRHDRRGRLQRILRFDRHDVGRHQILHLRRDDFARRLDLGEVMVLAILVHDDGEQGAATGSLLRQDIQNRNEPHQFLLVVDDGRAGHPAGQDQLLDGLLDAVVNVQRPRECDGHHVLLHQLLDGLGRCAHEDPLLVIR
mmetsp:Transcript_14082/g.40164  ORF Transcript_14082/g.40164 Transcript_14082/m.40164 type:complete len:234 (-) Transcript_14082:259-960(-)